ncbi:MAG: hypothetical protein AAGU21_09085 [Solidesulfovibrio sp.]|uniref:hypothetical protein n=1 Tax=Solidesulfovibrio sp. TaxID=2910990 RepID=UPI002B1EDD3E|nr:hypothetical protein [Solidesulfovibrio sp.]MEA4855214.1 hypothetical protein [Solidesulfovibrio sp.]
MSLGWKVHREGVAQKAGLLVLWAALGLYLLDKTAMTNADPDLWGYLAFGRLFWEGGFPYKDVFAFTPVKDVWVYHEWLLGVLYYKLVGLFGFEALQYLKYAALLATLFLAVAVSRLRGAGMAAAFLAAAYVTPVFAMNASPTRAKVFSHLFFVLTVLALERFRRGGRLAGVLPLVPLFAFWANVHGEVAVGFLALGAYAVGALLDRDVPAGRRIGALGLACFAATFVNPYGPSLWTFFLYAWKHPRPDILEWQNIFHFIAARPEFGLFFATLGLVVVAAVLLGKSRRDAVSLLMLFGFLVAAAKSVRMLTYLCLAVVLYVPALIDPYVQRLLDRARPLRRLALPGLVLLGLGYCLWQGGALWRRGIASLKVVDVAAFRPDEGLLYYPLDGLRHIRETRPAGRIMPQFEWGEYLLWSLPPAYRVGMDGRYETVYDDAYTDAYFAFVGGRLEPGAFLDRYGADIVVLRKTEKAWPAMGRLPDWEEGFSNAGYSVFYRKRDAGR